jgi:arylsulfatase A-like enzyme
MKWPLHVGATLMLTFVLSASRSHQAAGPNVVLIVIDTARADHFSCYGYVPVTTPRLDAFAREAVRFEHAYSTSTWTLPAHASLFTGLFPVSHRATQEHLFLDDRFETLAELLHGRGYATAAFSGNPFVSQRTNLSQGFDLVAEMWRRPDAAETGAHPHATNRLIFDWLRRRDAQRPFFLFVNYIEPHFPYDAPAAYESRFVPPDTTSEERRAAQVRWVDWYLHPTPFAPRVALVRSALYDAELAYADAIVGELLTELQRIGLYDRSIIVVTSDHGENLGDHGQLDHVFSLYNTTLHVPLLLRLPGGRLRNTVRTDPVQLTDVFSTLATITGVTAGNPLVAGHNLLDGPAPGDRAIFAEYYYPQQALSVFPPDQQSSPALDRLRRRLRSIQVGSQKFIWGSNGQDELYDLGVDPNEQQNLVAQGSKPLVVLDRQLQDTVRRYQGTEPLPRPSPPLDAATQERLRALGYLPGAK